MALKLKNKFFQNPEKNGREIYLKNSHVAKTLSNFYKEKNYCCKFL